MPTELGGQPAYVTVISAGRPGSVPRMEAFCEGLGPTWYVPAEEMGEYVRAGARWVASSRDMNDARNLALDDARGAWNVQLSDDLHRLQLMTPLGKRPVGLPAALGQLVAMCVRYGAHLGGAAPTDNAYFAKTRLSFHKFIVGDLLVMDSACPERFDPLAALKSDYDFTLQHLAAYGKVVRWDYLLASFDHKTNRGGCPAYRTEAIEQGAIAHLKAKWPGCVADNPRRANEILIHWPGSLESRN